MTEPFHPGEISIQNLTGERDIAVRNGRMVVDHIPDRTADYIAQQQYCLVGWETESGDFWAALLAGDAGFASSSADGATLRLGFQDQGRNTPAFAGLRDGGYLGVLFIDLAKRRRIRINGVMAGLSDGGLDVSVAEAFPNCPKYIQSRHVFPAAATAMDTATSAGGTAVTEEIIRWITAADTFFVASGLQAGLIDVSHRGGNPGFVTVKDGILDIPDYPGNSMFGTLGNFAANPVAGLTFIDFHGSRQLQLTGDVRLQFEGGGKNDATGGTGRSWRFTPRRWTISPLGRALAWTAPENSPFNP